MRYSFKCELCGEITDYELSRKPIEELQKILAEGDFPCLHCGNDKTKRIFKVAKTGTFNCCYKEWSSPK